MLNAYFIILLLIPVLLIAISRTRKMNGAWCLA